MDHNDGRCGILRLLQGGGIEVVEGVLVGLYVWHRVQSPSVDVVRGLVLVRLRSKSLGLLPGPSS